MKEARKRELKIGAFFLAGVFAVLIVLEFAGSVPFISNQRSLNIYFDSVSGLEEGAFVKMEGVRVGNIKNIDFAEDGKRIKVTVAVRTDVALRKDTVASVRLSSLLGTSYINLSIGSPDSPLLPPGYAIEGESSYDVDKIIQDAGMLMSEASQAAVRLNSILTKIDDGKGSVGKIVNEDDLYFAAKDVVAKADKSLDTIEDLAPVSFIVSVFGIAATFY